VQREDDLRVFARWHVHSGDIDPVYPVLSMIEGELCRDDYERVALTFLYVAYYNLPSAVMAWTEGWRPGQELTWQQMKRPTGTERRAHRDPAQFAPHIFELGRMLRPDYIDVLQKMNWYELQDELARWRGNGRWAAYKTGEMLGQVNGWDIEPLDAGHANSSGPRKGLSDIYPDLVIMTGNNPNVIRLLDRRTDALAAALELPIRQVETVLCDWHSTLKGSYYVGHDIDLMLEQALHPSVTGAERLLIIDVRQDCFDQQWLGEARGWPGVRRELKRRYRDEGKLIWWS
jgi:Alpha-glutamyl/putrescinyl thymine pyrophosphorylase clade 2